MRVVLVVVSLMAVVFGAVVLAGPGTAQAQQNVCQSNPSPVDPSDPSIIVNTPSANDSVTSPLHIEGQARVFEANVSIKLFDASGNELVSTFTTAQEGGVLSPFSTDVPFSVSASTPACLWVFETSAQDGSSVNVVQVPLTLLPGGLPDTGRFDDGGGVSPAMWAAAALVIAGAALVGAALPVRRRTLRP